MSDSNKAGSAFPRAGHEWSDMEWVAAPAQAGMTLRDYFAAKAMAGLLSRNIDKEDSWNDDELYIAEFAYEVADAMIDERNK